MQGYYDMNLIVRRLSEYPFVEKMLFCQFHSSRIMTLTGLNFLDTPNAIYPWELEIFAELSLFANENNPPSHTNKTVDEFIQIINTIRNYEHPYLNSKKDLSFADSLIMACGAQQFKAQEQILYRMYRYNYFWNFSNNKINMPTVFSHAFNNLTYSDFRNFGALIFFLASLEEFGTPAINYLSIKHIKIVNFLSKLREEYQKQQSEKIDDNFENTIYGFNYLHSHPYITYNEVTFLPLPYLIIDAITDSLLTRVTIENSALREVIGKEVAQAYIEEIFKECNLYDEVLPEEEYYKGKNRIDTPDILIKKGEQFCLIDTKLSTPKLEIRKFNEITITETISRYAKNIIQVYRRMQDFTQKYYYPFSTYTKIQENNIFGIVALLEDSYISRGQIYQEVFQILKLDPESKDAHYIKSNISITSFHDLEQFALGARDIFVALNAKKNNPTQWNNMTLFSGELFSKTDSGRPKSVEKFIFDNKEILQDTLNELIGAGILSNTVPIQKIAK